MYLAFSVPHDFRRADKQHSRKSVFGFDSQYIYKCRCKIAMVAISQLRQDMFLRISFKKLRFIDPRAKRSAVPLEGMAKRRSSAHVLTSDCTGAGSTDSYQLHHASTSNRAFDFQLALRARFPSAVEQTGDFSSWRIQHNAKNTPILLKSRRKTKKTNDNEGNHADCQESFSIATVPVCTTLLVYVPTVWPDPILNK
jgi:hypothetical protein